MSLLDGKKLLITGVITRDSIAWEVARQAQEAGAEVVLTGFGRAKRMTERAAQKLPQPPDVLELDVNEPEHLKAVADDPEEARGRFAREYTDEHLTSAVAAAEGYVDEIVPPSDTRRRLTEALRTLEAVAHPAHGVRNIPL